MVRNYMFLSIHFSVENEFRLKKNKIKVNDEKEEKEKVEWWAG